VIERSCCCWLVWDGGPWKSLVWNWRTSIGDEASSLFGRGKPAERLPLPARVGAVITAYLRHGRLATAQGRSVFVRVHAPHRALISYLTKPKPMVCSQTVISAPFRSNATA